MNEMDAWARYIEHRRQMAWINEHGWKIEKPARRSARVAMAKALLALAQRIAPVSPEAEQRADALAQP